MAFTRQIVICFFLFLLLLSCQSGTLSGYVTNSQTEKPIPNVRLELYFNSEVPFRTATTDQVGFYKIERIPFETYILEIMVSGYDKMNEPLLEIKEREVKKDYFLFPENKGKRKTIE